MKVIAILFQNRNKVFNIMLCIHDNPNDHEVPSWAKEQQIGKDYLGLVDEKDLTII